MVAYRNKKRESLGLPLVANQDEYSERNSKPT